MGVAYQAALDGNLPAATPDAPPVGEVSSGLVAFSDEDKKLVAQACRVMALRMQMSRQTATRYQYERLARRVLHGA